MIHLAVESLNVCPLPLKCPLSLSSSSKVFNQSFLSLSQCLAHLTCPSPLSAPELIQPFTPSMGASEALNALFPLPHKAFLSSSPFIVLKRGVTDLSSFCLSYSVLSSLEEGAMSVLITIISLVSNTVPGTQDMFTKLICMYAVDP